VIARVPKCLVAALVCLVALAGLGSTAQAGVTTIGSVRTDFLESTNLGSSGSLTVANVALGFGGIPYAPSDGTIVRWRISGGIGGPFYLRVLRPTGGGYVGVGKSGGELPASVATQTFTTNLPIRAGDLIGIDTTNKTDEIGGVLSPSAAVSAWVPVAPEGTLSFPLVTNSGSAEVTFNAEMIPLPRIAALGPAKGSIAGGYAITLSGSDFLGATAVSFGGTPAALFPVLSDTSLSFVVPKTSKPGAVDVTVTTPGGTSAPVKFTYVACKVPNLKGKTVKAAKKALKKANCKLGKLRGKGPKVVAQSLKAGTVKPANAKVGLKKGEG
jgi:IPT/TIG domain/PASTA domain